MMLSLVYELMKTAPKYTWALEQTWCLSFKPYQNLNTEVPVDAYNGRSSIGLE